MSFTDNVITRNIAAAFNYVSTAMGWNRDVQPGNGEPLAAKANKGEASIASTPLTSREIGSATLQEINILKTNRLNAERFVIKNFHALEKGQQDALLAALLQEVDTSSLHRGKILEEHEMDALLKGNPKLRALSIEKPLLKEDSSEEHPLRSANTSLSPATPPSSKRANNVKKAKAFFAEREKEVLDYAKNRTRGMNRERLKLIEEAFEYEVMLHSEIHRKDLSDEELSQIFEKVALSKLTQMRFPIPKPHQPSIKIIQPETYERGMAEVRKQAELDVAKAKSLKDNAAEKVTSFSIFRAIVHATDNAYQEYESSDLFKEEQKATYYTREVKILLEEMEIEDPRLKSSRTWALCKSKALNKARRLAKSYPNRMFTRAELVYRIQTSMRDIFITEETALLISAMGKKGDAFKEELKKQINKNVEAFCKMHPEKLCPLDQYKAALKEVLVNHANDLRNQNDAFCKKFRFLGKLSKQIQNKALQTRLGTKESHESVINERNIDKLIDAYLVPAVKRAVRSGTPESLLIGATKALMRTNRLMRKTASIKEGKEPLTLQKLSIAIKELETKQREIAKTKFLNPRAHDVRKYVILELNNSIAQLKERAQALEETMGIANREMYDCMKKTGTFFEAQHAGCIKAFEDNTAYTVSSRHAFYIGFDFLDAVQAYAIKEGVDKVTPEWMAATLERITIERTIKSYRSGQGSVDITDRKLIKGIQENIRLQKTGAEQVAKPVSILAIAISAVSDVWISYKKTSSAPN